VLRWSFVRRYHTRRLSYTWQESGKAASIRLWAPVCRIASRVQLERISRRDRISQRRLTDILSLIYSLVCLHPSSLGARAASLAVLPLRAVPGQCYGALLRHDPHNAELSAKLKKPELFLKRGATHHCAQENRKTGQFSSLLSPIPESHERDRR